jgi:hypothetical protein
MPPLPPAAAVGEGEGAGEESDGPPPAFSDDDNDAPPPPPPSSPPRVLLTPKDRIVLDVLGRYPPLRESVLEAAHRNGGGASDHRGDAGAVLAGGNDRGDNDGAEEENARLFADNVLSLLGCAVPSGLGECGVRQAHHPMLAGAAQSDMDDVFVGTASYTPGSTRGVSCTALRLNWRRKADKGAGMASRTTAAVDGNDGEVGRAPPGRDCSTAANQPSSPCSAHPP